MLDAAARPGLNTSHRVAAWNTLCALIDQCSQSDLEGVRNGKWDFSIWYRAFNLYLNQSHSARPKSSKQLLATLSATLRKSDTLPELKERIGIQLLGGLFDDKDHHRTKACLQALAHFLRTEVLALDYVLTSFRGLRHKTSNMDPQARVEDLLSILFTWVGKGDFGSVVGQAISVVLDKSQHQPNVSHPMHDLEPGSLASMEQPLWSGPLHDAVRSGSVKIDDLRIHVLPTLFKRSLTAYVSFLHAHGFGRLVSRIAQQKHEPVDDELLHAALQTGKELGFLYETDELEVSQTATYVLIPVRCIGRLLSKCSRSARLAGMSLLITSHAMTRPFPERTFKLLRRHLATFFADTDANFRSEVFSLIQKLIDRLRASTAVLARQVGSIICSAETIDLRTANSLHSHKTFLEWIVRFLSWELRPTASYQRHISALKTLLIVARSGLDDGVPTDSLSKSALGETKFPFRLSIPTPALRRLLLDLLMDPFDDVRQTSATILSLYSTSYNYEDRCIASKELSQTISRAEDMMLATGRADQADGVAHMYALLYQACGDSQTVSGSRFSSRQILLMHLVKSLERMLDVAETDLISAVKKYPMHGILASIRYVLTQSKCQNDFESLPSRIETCLHRVWEVVKPVLCDDAPEGYLPDEIEGMPEISTKDTLSYCWRALKESSLLLGVVFAQSTTTMETIVSLGNLCFAQLAELRHRGAFSTVAQTWITCCKRCKDLKSADGQPLSRLCYGKTLQILTRGSTINTRRSAGLPSLLCGLLIADKTGESVSQAFTDLTKIAHQSVASTAVQDGNLPQVHALNCMKDILRNTQLGEQSENYVPQSIQLAATSLRSEAWAIRNCGLMLFRAVVDRLLGTNDAYMDESITSHRQISAQEHPQLLDVVLDLLAVKRADRADDRSRSNEGVFPALQLLLRLQVPGERRAEVRAAVFALTTNPSWHVRDKAARTYANIAVKDEIDAEIQTLLGIGTSNQNALHGTLLSIKYLIARIALASAAWLSKDIGNAEGDTFEDNLSHARLCAVASVSHLYHDNRCPITKAAYVDVLVDSIRLVPNHGGISAFTPEESHGPATNTLAPIDIMEELKGKITARDHNPAEPILRSSLVGAFRYDKPKMTSTESEQAVWILLHLAQVDPDVCSSVFCEHRDDESSTLCPNRNALLAASGEILSGDYDVKLKCEVQRYLLSIVDFSHCSEDTSDCSQALVKASTFASSPLHGAANQQYVDQWLQLRATTFEYHIGSSKDNHTILSQELASWVSACCLVARGSGLCSREAAAFALNRTKNILGYLDTNEPTLFCDVCLAVYDMLNDDDEDVRFLAAGTTSRIVGLDAHSSLRDTLEPGEASQNLATFMVKKWSGYRHFCREAFKRAFDVNDLQYHSVAHQLTGFAPTDTALFAEEKQNLYVDEVKEFRLWSQVILRLDVLSIPRPLIRLLARWIDDGLDALTARAQLEMDGALGWSTNANVFRLGLQVVYGAEVLLYAVEQGDRLPVQPSTLRLKLGRLAAAATTNSMHELWILEIDRVMTMAVARKVTYCDSLAHLILESARA